MDAKEAGQAPTSVRITRALAEEEREFNICVVTMTPGGRIWVEGNPNPEVRANFPGPEAVGHVRELLPVPGEQHRAGGALAVGLVDRRDLTGGHVELRLRHTVGPAETDHVGLGGRPNAGTEAFANVVNIAAKSRRRTGARHC